MIKTPKDDISLNEQFEEIDQPYHPKPDKRLIKSMSTTKDNTDSRLDKKIQDMVTHRRKSRSLRQRIHRTEEIIQLTQEGVMNGYTRYIITYTADIVNRKITNYVELNKYCYNSKKSLTQNLRCMMEVLQEDSSIPQREVVRWFKALNIPLFLPNYSGHYDRYRNVKYKEQLIHLKMILSCCDFDCVNLNYYEGKKLHRSVTK